MPSKNIFFNYLHPTGYEKKCHTKIIVHILKIMLPIFLEYNTYFINHKNHI